MQPGELLEVATQAARAAAPLLLERFGSERAIATKSSDTDLVSEADMLAEAAIRAVLAQRVPDDAIVGEEGKDVPGTSGRRWIVDPIDGTVDYVYGHPQWCISVACEGLAGVVFDPLRDELFTAHSEGPATLNERELHGPPPRELAHALIATGFGYERSVREAQVAGVAALIPQVRDIRRAGSAALDLCWLAAGRVDAYYEHGVKIWDTAAGQLICERAGLDVVRLDASGPLPSGLIAARAELIGQLRAIIG